jgi:uncharacterized repeat protein (TIGR01451 family)
MKPQLISPSGGTSLTGRILTALLLFSLYALFSCGGGQNGGNGGGGQSATPSLSVSAVTQGNFSNGQQGATYNIAVSNNGTAATSGTVTVVDPPTGFTVTGITGANWTCTLSTTTCTRSDPLAPGQSYPPITVTGNVTAANGASVSIPLSASGGGMSAAVNSAPSVTVAAPALSVNETNTANFNLGQQGATYTVTVKNGASAGATNAAVTVTETVPADETLVSMSGTGWTCPGHGGPNTCDRSDTLVTGASYPALTVAVNVAANATSPQLSQVAVSGGGMASSASGSDSTTINVPDLAINVTQSGKFIAGANGTFNISVGNDATGATAGPTGGPITVTDTLATQFSYVSASATGWSCAAAVQIVTCTNPGPINPGSSAATIPLIVSVSSSAEGTISNTASAVTYADGNASNNSSTASVTFSPDVAIAESHSGNFGAGTDGAFSLSVSNVGNAATTGSITLTDTLGQPFTFVSGNASGWTCSAASQLVTCTNPGPLAPGALATSIPLIVAVNASSSGAIANSGTVSTPGDTNVVNNSFTDSVSVLGTGSLPELISVAVPGGNARGVIYAGGNAENVNITVVNEGTGDVLTPTLTLNDVACTSCGTLGAITAGTPGHYTVFYTPPTSVSAPTNVTITVSSNVAGSFPATGNFTVFPAGTRVVKITGIPGGPGTENLTAFVYNDSGTTTGLTIELLGAGYACPPAVGGGTVCGTLTIGAPSSGTTTGNGTTGIPYTSVPLTFTPPATMPNPPFDMPMILAVSNADSSKRAQINFAVGPGGVAGGMFGTGSRLNTALTGSAPITLAAGVGGDMGVNQSLNWTLTAGGASCQPGCGTLGPPTYFWNGGFINAFVTYTPPATVPASPADQPVLTVASVDVINGFQPTDSVQFQVKDGTCGTGNESALNGQYAFLLQGGAAVQGYAAVIGSFTADGTGHITGGLLDVNRTGGPATGLSILSAGSSYSIGADNRGCLTLANSSGGSATFRFAVGSLDGSKHATQGQMTRFDDVTGVSQRVQGSLMKQDPAAFSNLAVGNYVFGYQGIQSAGARLAVVGLYHADAAGNLTSFDTDAIDGQGNSVSNLTTGSGTYSFDPTTGRGTGTVTNGGTSNTVFYAVNSSEFLSMTTDALGPNTPIVSGLNQKQTTTSFTQTSLDNNPYVFYQTAFDPSSGDNVVGVAQVQFSTDGVNTGEQDVNDAGTVTTQAVSGSLTISPNGRMVGQNVVLYAIDTDSAVILDTNTSVPFGYAQRQTGGPLTDASLSGPVFFGGGAVAAGTSSLIGTGSFDGAGGFTGNIDVQHPWGESPSLAIDYSYSITPANGKVTFTSTNGGLVGFVISKSRVVFIPTGSSPQLIVGQ